MNYEVDFFNMRLNYVYENYYKKGQINPTNDSNDVFPKELGGTLIRVWLHGNKRKLSEFSNLGNVKAEKVIGNNIRNIIFLSRINYIYKNYYLNGKLNPSQKDDDRFPEELGKSLIGPWIQSQKYNIKMLKNNFMASIILRNSKINYLAELVNYIVTYERIPFSEDLFSDKTSMKKFLEENKKRIYKNKDEDNYLGLLGRLLENLDCYYFMDLEDKSILNSFRK